jgi:bacteriocin biosynthesis cyclodehydratase domain-containing protein
MPVSDHPPFLAPGLRVVARGRDHLQVGLYDDRRVLLPRTAAVEQTLGCLLERRPVGEDPGVAEVLGALDRAGCLSRHRPGAVPVAVLGGLAAAGLPDLVALFAAKGVPTGPVSGAGVVLVLSEGELDRDRLDPLIRSGTSHLVVRLVDGGAVLGPFVVPGATACLRCIDAAHSVRDPDHVPVTSRYVRATAQPRSDGVPDLDLATAATAVAWAARDVIAFAAGHEPSTWSRTWHLRVEGGPVEQEWSRDPLCGCCWPADALTWSPAPAVAFP